jgi:sigma-B regulation protein RsbU (phosphoserine phosphatase)
MNQHLDHAPCFYFSCREEGILLRVNNTLCERLGYNQEELEGKSVDQILTIASRIFRQTHFGPMLRLRGHAEEIFITLKTKDGEEVPILFNARQEQDDAGGYAHIGIEVQNRKRYEDEIIAARKAAEAALQDNSVLTETKQELEKHLETLDQQMFQIRKHNRELVQLNKIVTHDLQEPIRKLSVFANMLQKGWDGEATQNVLPRLVGAVNQMRHVTSGLQQYMWLSETAVTLTLVDLEKLLMEVRTQLLEEHPDVELLIDAGELSPILADEPQVRILFYQLLSNVIRFRKEGHPARAQLRQVGLTLNKYRSIEGRYKYTEFTKLELSDSGVGFVNEFADTAFDLFRRLHSNGGQGIGLALCRKVAEKHYGEISIAAQEGKGATVTVLLPVNIPELAPPSLVSQ